MSIIKKIVSILIIVLVGWFIYSVFAVKNAHKTDEVVQQDSTSGMVEEPGLDIVDDNGFFVSELAINDNYANREHIVTGSLDLPDPCYSIDSSVMVAESYPEQVMIQLTTPREEGMCAQVITPTEFSVTFQASEEAVISLMLNGKQVTLVQN